MLTQFSILSLFFLIVSCSGNKSSSASLKFEVHGMAANAAGGLVITGKGPNKETFSKIVSSNSIVLELTRGSWEFSAVSWQGPQVFEGEVRCASSVVNIEGNEAQVTLAMSNGACFNATFSSELGDGSPLAAGTIGPQFCESDVSSQTTPCTYTPASPVAPANKSGFVGSYRIVVNGDAETGDLSSDCYDPDTNQVVSDTDFLSELNIPAFTSNTGINVTFKAYLGEGCEDLKGVIDLPMSDNTKAKFNVISDFNKDLFVKVPLSEVCTLSTKQNQAGTFASGTGTTSNPHVICNRKQLIHLQNTWDGTSVTDHAYILGNDIDLSTGIYKGVVSADVMSTCLSLGDSFVPMGKYFDGSCNILNRANEFSGVFDGNKKIIKSFRFKDSSVTALGFISRVAGGGQIYDLNFESADVEGDSEVGIVAGYIDGSTVKRIQIKNSRVQGSSKVGSVLGYANTVTHEDFYAKGMFVKGHGETGGLIGSSGSNFTRGHFIGNIDSQGGNYIGGIAGKVAQLTEAVAEGLMSARGQYVGGLAGEIAGASNIVMYSRSGMFIHDLDTSPSGSRLMGGLVGNTTDAVSRSYFNGAINSQCNGPGCNIGSIAGSASATPFTYSAIDYTATGGIEAGAYPTLVAMSQSGSTLVSDICFADGPACKWITQVSGDYARLDFEAVPTDTGHCTQAVNNLPFATQAGRGNSEASPFIICKASQLIDVINHPGKFYSVRQNINLNELSGMGTFPVPSGRDFSGSLNGNGNALYYFNKANPGISYALFNMISSGSTIKNLDLAGFKIIETGVCNSSPCRLSTLAISNSGTLDKVRVIEAMISVAINADFSIGGIADYNSGSITDSEVSGFLKNEATVGGIVNGQGTSGVISGVESSVEIHGGGTGNGFYIGGVVARNNGKVAKSRFSGKITNFVTASYVGGIIGQHLNSALSIVENSEVTRDALIWPFVGGSTNLGGIVGGSGPLAKITRNVFQGFFQDENTLVVPILGGGSAVLTNNHFLTSHYQTIDGSAGVSGTSYNNPTKTCTISIASAIDNGPFPHGAAAFYGTEAVMGTVVDTGANTYDLLVRTSSDRCTNYGVAGNAEFFHALTAPETITPSQLAAVEGYDLVDMGVGVDVERAVTAYIELLLTGTTVNPPIWEYDASEPVQLKLFGRHD